MTDGRSDFTTTDESIQTLLFVSPISELWRWSSLKSPFRISSRFHERGFTEDRSPSPQRHRRRSSAIVECHRGA
ncbi:unnamed protein product [Arabis nemorensis]|uniref:Uncharacterized protein n=1 Tax=Arabis nemorensis TaxID=586526 RepID=A0A565BYJ5_9BRAS|nr:unnamed protein product [Arabis nemorensis]